MRVVLAGGGTAGHVNPAIALAGALDGHDVHFIGTERGVEARLVPAAGYPLETIEVKGFDRAKPWALPAVGLKAAAAVGAARRVLRARRAEVVVGMGGYVSLPACLAARTLRIPVVLHEQNIVLGLAHKATLPFARTIGVSFARTLEETKGKGIHTGNPVLSTLLSEDAESARARGVEMFGLERDRSTLLVFGGSLGARRVNDAAAGLARVWRKRSDLQILHITGANDHAAVLKAVQGDADGGLIYRVESYVADMAAAYAAADLVLCRAGATTVAELTVLGKPSVLVPYPHHRDRQQERHAEVLGEHQAAEVLLDNETTTGTVADLCGTLLADRSRRATMSAAARSLGRPDAAVRLAEVVKEAAA